MGSALITKPRDWPGTLRWTPDLTSRDITNRRVNDIAFTPMEAAWLEMLQPTGLITNVRVRVPGP